jgi:hypothetical protein
VRVNSEDMGRPKKTFSAGQAAEKVLLINN